MQKGIRMMQSGGRSLARAFTLIELLVVIGIIAVLVAIGFTVATTVLNSGRSQATQSTIIALESAVGELSTSAGLRPKDYKAYEFVDGSQSVLLPIADGRLGTAGFSKSDRALPSLGRLLRVVKETVPGIESRWQQLDSSSLQVSDIGNDEASVSGDEVLDTWGNPIRFVHPSFDGGYGDWFDSEGDRERRDELDLPGGVTGQILTLRRSFRPFNPTNTTVPDPIGDADEGICPGGSSGYLYSAGPDGDPGTRADNVYASVIPEYPAETAGQE